MQEIDKLTRQMQEAIKNSFEYKEYMRLNELINRNPDVRQRVDELRRENFEINNCAEDVDIIAASDALNEKYNDLREVENVSQYLASEICLCRMIAEICRNIVDAVDMDMDFL